MESQLHLSQMKKTMNFNTDDNEQLKKIIELEEDQKDSFSDAFDKHFNVGVANPPEEVKSEDANDMTAQELKEQQLLLSPEKKEEQQ